MLYLYYGPKIFVRNRELRKKLEDVSGYHNKSEFSFDGVNNNDIINTLWGEIRSVGLFPDRDYAVRVLILNNLRALNKNNIKKLKNILKYCENNKNIFCFIKESWNKKTLPVFAESIFDSLEYSSYFFGELDKSSAIRYIKDELSSDGIKIAQDIISIVYDMEGGDLFGTFNELKRLSFLKLSKNKFIEFLKKEHISTITMWEFSKAIIQGASISKKIYMLNIMFQSNNFYYGAVAYLSKVSSDSNILNRLAGYDIKIKSGLLDQDLALLDMVLI